MDKQTFDRTLKSFTKRATFQPFIVETISGSTFEVDHPEALVFRQGVAVFVDKEGQPYIFDNNGVSHFKGRPESIIPS